MTKIYQWKRFWCLRTGTTNLDDNGFLSNPTSEYGSFTNPDLRSLEQILPHRFLGLLGEPGIGKSKAVELEKEKIDALIKNAGDKSLWLNLNSIGTEDRLIKELFDSPEFQSLKAGNHNLHIFLDSLDEALMRIDVLTSLLLEKIRKQFHDRIFLRVSCRTAIWPQSLEDQAKAIWSKESVGVYELASLTKVDFKNAAAANEIDPERFLQEVIEKDAAAFAIKPVTLNFLIDIFKTSQRLPSSQIDLYEAGCLHLCEEHNPSHKETRIQSTLTARQKMEVASRIAAVTVFSNKTTIWKGSASQMPEEALSSDLFLGNFIFKDGQSISLSTKLIDEVLDTGLFSSRGPHSFGWSHKTYAEFLAAKHMSQFPINQISSLLFSPDDEENKIIPQLQETTGWLSSMVPALFQNIVATDPEVLLRSDVFTDDIHKQAIVASLIEMHRNKRVITSFELKQRVHKLKHPNLSQQIKGILLDKNEDEDLRAFIINLIEACDLEDLFSELPQIALNKQEPLHIRSVASRALVETGSETDKIRLKPLLSVSPEDPLDDLRGTALHALWPKQLNAKDLFDILTPAPNDHYVGSYDFFMGHQIIPNILPGDWQFALDWAAQQANENLSYSTEKLVEDIFVSAWDHIDQEKNLNAYANAIKARVKKSLDFLRRDRASEFSLKVKSEHSKRRSLLEKLIPLFINEENSLFWLLYSGVLIAEDVEWMTEKVLSASDDVVKSVWCKTIEYASSWENPDCSQVVYRASEKDPFMARRFEWLGSAIVLDSPQALKLRADHESMRESQNRRKPKMMETKTFIERILSRLSVIESTNPKTWLQLTQDLTIDLKSSTYREHFKSDVTVGGGEKGANLGGGGCGVREVWFERII